MISMSQFTHSLVLFTGEDGMPLEFNVQYCIDKDALSEMIEHGGGLCTHTDNAIYLVTPGTKVLNINTNKKIVSSKFIYDCVAENYLLELDDYKIEIHVVETSDFSEELTLNVVADKSPENRRTSEESDNSIDIIEGNKSLSPPVLTKQTSNHDFDFDDTESRNIEIPDKLTMEGSESNVKIPDQVTVEDIENRNIKILDKVTSPMPQQDQETSAPNITAEKERKSTDESVNEVPDSVDELNLSENMEIANQALTGPSNTKDDSISAVIVSSSQPNDPGLDGFDEIILNKLKEKPTEPEDDSQSYTVSSSADAQVSPKLSPHNTSAEIFSASSAAPDSASQTRERQQYINNLEKEIAEILKKPSPKSIQDKTTLVKYICCVKKLSPAIVLQTLQNF